MTQQSGIKLIITGGTIDKHYNELNGSLVFADTHIPNMLKQSRCKADINIETILQKDSLEMEDADRALILEACENSSESMILITHGTDTMTLTAEHIAKHVKDKTIVLLGSMIPYAFKNSDALFNLGTAVAAVQCLPADVYITMNGQIFKWDNVTKNRQAGRFETEQG